MLLHTQVTFACKGNTENDQHAGPARVQADMHMLFWTFYIYYTIVWLYSCSLDNLIHTSCNRAIIEETLLGKT